MFAVLPSVYFEPLLHYFSSLFVACMCADRQKYTVLACYRCRRCCWLPALFVVVAFFMTSTHTHTYSHTHSQSVGCFTVNLTEVIHSQNFFLCASVQLYTLFLFIFFNKFTESTSSPFFVTFCYLELLFFGVKRRIFGENIKKQTQQNGN